MGVRYVRAMSKTILVVGFGPGISSGVAETFGKQGFAVALVGRTADRVAAGAAALVAQGVRAQGFVADASQPASLHAAIAQARAAFGPISAVHWNAYGGGAGDFTTASGDELRAVFDVAIVGLVTTVQALLPDLKAEKGAVLVTNGGLGMFDDKVDTIGAQFGLMGLSVANSAKHKTVRLLAKKLAPDGIYVGEVMVTGSVKGTPFDRGGPTLEPSAIGARFWRLYQERTELSVVI